ncbi:uncharacterized protein VP01_11397g1, partial [Puccinia sorghi]
KSTPMPTKTTTKNPAIQRKYKKNRGNDSSEDDDKTAGKAPAVDCPEKGKINGFEMMAINLRNQSPKVHTKSIATGFGSTNEDGKAGICTIDEKLESMFPLMGADNKMASSTSETAGNELRSSDMESNGDY